MASDGDLSLPGSDEMASEDSAEFRSGAIVSELSPIHAGNSVEVVKDNPPIGKDRESGKKVVKKKKKKKKAPNQNTSGTYASSTSAKRRVEGGDLSHKDQRSHRQERVQRRGPPQNDRIHPLVEPLVEPTPYIIPSTKNGDDDDGYPPEYEGVGRALLTPVGGVKDTTPQNFGEESGIIFSDTFNFPPLPLSCVIVVGCENVAFLS